MKPNRPQEKKEPNANFSRICKFATASACGEKGRNGSFRLAFRQPIPTRWPGSKNTMKTRTKISWADFTLNPWEGCTKVSAGCKHCYAETRNQRFSSGSNWGAGAPRRKSKSALTDIATINRRFAPDGVLNLMEVERTRDRFIHNLEPWPEDLTPGDKYSVVKPQVFSLSLGDILDPEIPAEWLAEWLAAIVKADNLEFLLLTKRPELFYERMKAVEAIHPVGDYSGALERFATTGFPHIAWGTSVEDQTATKRLRHLAAIPAKRRFVSCEPLIEPLIGPVELAPSFARHPGEFHLVITGGESGTQARPCHPAWVNDIDAACREAKVPHHFKQWGEWAPSQMIPLDDNQRNPANRLWVGIDGSIGMPSGQDSAALPCVAMHRRQTRSQAPAMIGGKKQQPRLIFP